MRSSSADGRGRGRGQPPVGAHDALELRFAAAGFDFVGRGACFAASLLHSAERVAQPRMVFDLSALDVSSARLRRTGRVFCAIAPTRVPRAVSRARASSVSSSDPRPRTQNNMDNGRPHFAFRQIEDASPFAFRQPAQGVHLGVDVTPLVQRPRARCITAHQLAHSNTSLPFGNLTATVY